MRNLKLVLPAIFLILTACGGGGGGGGGSDGVNTNTTSPTLSAVKMMYSKGPVSDAAAYLYDALGNEIAGPVLTNTGIANFTDIIYSGLVYATFYGGTYTDEATGSIVTLSPTFKIRSGVGSISDGVTIELVATPLTEIGFKRAENASSGLVDLSSVNTFIAVVANEYGLDGINLSTVSPSPLSNISGSSDADKYGVALVAISQQQLNSGNTTPNETALSDYITSNAVTINSALYVAALEDATTNTNTSSFVEGTLITQIAANIDSFTIGGAVTGIPDGNAVVLQINNGNDLAINANGAFTFGTSYPAGSDFSISISSSSENLLCESSNATGVISQNVTNVTVQCKRLYDINLNVTGLSGTLSLEHNGTSETINLNGTYIYDENILPSDSYTVNISNQPEGQICDLESYANTSLTKTLDSSASGINLNIHCVSVLNKAGELASGVPKKIATQGDYAYTGTEHGIYVSNISIPSNITPVGFVGKFNVVDLTIRGNYLYALISGGRTRMVVIDISNPATPLVVNTQYRSKFGFAVSITDSGNYLYLITDGGGITGRYSLIVYDVSTPEAPIIVGQLPDILVSIASPSTAELSVDGGYAYLAADVASLIVIDVNNPATPTQVARVLGSEVNILKNYYCSSVTAKGQYAYLFCGSDFFIFDISDPLTPIKVALYEDIGPLRLVISGNNAYLYSYESVTDAFNLPIDTKILLRTADISGTTVPVFTQNSTSPIFSTGRGIGPTFEDVAISGNTMLFTHGFDGITTYGFSNLSNPVQVGVYDSLGSIKGTSSNVDMLYITERRGLKVIDATNIASMQFAGSLSYSVASRPRIKSIGSTVYSVRSGLKIIDASIPESPSLLSEYGDKYWKNLFDASGDYVYVLRDQTTAIAKLVVMDTSNPTTPVELGSFTLPQVNYRAFFDLVYNNGRVYISVIDGLLIFDVSDPVAPTLIGTYNDLETNTFLPDAIGISGQFAYMCNRDNNVRVIDNSNLTSPQLTGYVETSCSDISISGNYAYFSTEDGVRVFDVSDVNNFTEVARYNGPEMLNPKIEVANNKVYLSQYLHGLVVLDAF